MNEYLESARNRIMTLIEEERLPEHLVGDLSLDDIAELTSSLVTEGIKERLDLQGDMTDEEASDLIQGTLEGVAQTVGLICAQAILMMIDHDIIPEQSDQAEQPAAADLDPDFVLQLDAEQVSGLLTSLLRKEGILIGIALT